MTNQSEVTDKHTCKSCGNIFVGTYCNLCGEKIVKPAERSYKSFINSLLVAFTTADSKLIKTLWLMIRRPGFVSKEFANGRTVKYLKPSTVFFVLNLFYFFFPVIQFFNASLRTQLSSPHGELLKNFLALKIVKLNMTLESFTMIYNNKTVSLAKMMVMVFVLLASLPLNVLYRKKNRFFADHVGYAIELACFNLFINNLVLTLVVRTLRLGHYLDENAIAGIFIATNLYFLLRSGISFYNEKGWRLILKSVIMIFALVAALEIYRIILFFVTIWTM